jgi:hypothetical protein
MDAVSDDADDYDYDYVYDGEDDTPDYSLPV